VVGGSLVYFFEHNAAGTNLTHWGDCLWWAITTLSTVGYGEHFPVTLPGRLIAAGIMFTGVTIIGAVAAIVAFGFAERLAQRFEDAILQVESQMDTVEAEIEHVEEEFGEGSSHRAVRRKPQGSLREVRVPVPDIETGASLTWLLARLGWHPDADVGGLRWRQGSVCMALTVRGVDPTPGIPGQLTFTAGTVERTCRIARESQRHGFLRLTAEEEVPASLRTLSGFEVTLVAS
jgi:hypothetical protein